MSFDKDFNNLNIKLETPDIPDTLSDDILSKFDSEGHLGMMSSSGMFPQDNIYVGNTDDNEPDDIIILHMDIRQPLSALRALLEEKVGLNLKNYKFWLQDAQELEPHKNLVDQCVKGEGLVQINAQIQTISGRINIVDVLKPTEAALAALGSQNDYPDNKVLDENDDTVSSFDENNSNVVSGDDEHSDEKPKPDHVVNWVLDTKFKKDQSRLKIPEDPNEWTNAQVKHWLQWAVRQFNLTQIKLNEWDVSGKELCEISLHEFQKKVPHDPGNVFWTHLELLRKCKFVAVIHKAMENVEHDSNDPKLRKNSKIIKKPVTNLIKQYTGKSQSNSPEFDVKSISIGALGQWEVSGNRSGNNGQIQLWQFLLDILTDKDYKSIIQWIGGDGEFKLTDPERVAQLWGERKNKPAMNYEKLSRALRYYYDGDMISKVHGKRFVYKFVCDLKQLIGYNAKELAALVNQCEMDGFYKTGNCADYSNIINNLGT